MKRIALLLFICIFGFIFAGNATAGQETYRVPLSGEPKSLDPAFMTDIYAVHVAMNIYDGLVEFNKDLKITPSIAKRWKISRDQKTYTFQLRKDAKFHDGSKVTAVDFVYSFTRILDQETKSPVAWLFKDIKGAKAFNEGKAVSVAGLKAIDEHTLHIELEKPFAPFLQILGMYNAKVVPFGALRKDIEKHPVGTGPFSFVSWKQGEQLLLKKNAAYFGGVPKVENLQFRIYPNIEWETIYADFQQGKLDQSIVPSSKQHELKQKGLLSEEEGYIRRPTLSLVYLGLNTKKAPLNDSNVRRALSYAVDTQAIVEDVSKGSNLHTKGVLPPGVAGHDPKFKGYGYEPDTAKKLLAQAGYPEGKGLPVLKLWKVSKSESVQNELKAYQKYFSDIGVQSEIHTAETWKDYVKTIGEGKADLFYMAWYADYPDPDNFLHPLFHSESGVNRMGYNNPEVDRLLEASRREPDYLKRVEMMRRIQGIVMSEAPIICQHNKSFSFLFQPWVEGVEVGYLGEAYLPFDKMWVNAEQKKELAPSFTAGSE